MQYMQYSTMYPEVRRNQGHAERPLSDGEERSRKIRGVEAAELFFFRNASIGRLVMS